MNCHYMVDLEFLCIIIGIKSRKTRRLLNADNTDPSGDGGFVDLARSEIIDGVVHNTALPGSKLVDITEYIRLHIAEWTKRDVIWHVDAMDLTTATACDVHLFVDRGAEITELRKGRKTAVVAKNDLHFGMMRMLAILAEGRFEIALSVFRNVESAVQWLKESSD